MQQVCMLLQRIAGALVNANRCSQFLLVPCGDTGTSLLADEKSPSGQLLDAANRQAHLLRGLPVEVRRRRMVGWLQRRGHSWSTVSALLQRLKL